MTELIICEKPSAAKKIAEALAEGSPSKKNVNGVPYYELTHSGKKIIVGCAVGHLYTLDEKEKKYPAFDIEWVESHTKKGAECVFAAPFFLTN